jgi:hypothetical protein
VTKPVIRLDIRPSGIYYDGINFTDQKGTEMRRTIVSEGWVTTQIKLSDGSWWNIRIERVTGR